MSSFIVSILMTAVFAPPAVDRFVSVAGLRVHYVDAGHGTRAIVLIHGGACDASLWRNQVPLLQQYGRVLAIDLPGHGQSDKPARVYDLGLFLGAVDAVARDANAREVVVAGQSLGAMVAYEYARRHAATTKGLIWMEGTFHIPVNVDEQIAAMKTRVAQLRSPDYQARVIEAWNALFVPATPQAVRDEIRAKLLATPPHVLISAMENLMTPAMFRPQRLEVPTLAIFGAYWRPGDYETVFRRYLPRLEMHVVPDVGHFPMLEKPDVVNALLSAFLDRHFRAWRGGE